MMNKIMKEEEPSYILVAFDKGKTFRHDQYDWYKAGRVEMPNDLKLQFPKAKEVLDAMGIKHFEIDNYEADDIIDKVYGLIVSGTVENVIINDIALYYTDEQRKSAYVCMQKLEQKVRVCQPKTTITKWRYSDPKASGIPLYGEKNKHNTTVFKIPQEIIKYSPFLICDSISMIIQKTE